MCAFAASQQDVVAERIAFDFHGRLRSGHAMKENLRQPIPAQAELQPRMMMSVVEEQGWRLVNEAGLRSRDKLS